MCIVPVYGGYYGYAKYIAYNEDVQKNVTRLAIIARDRDRFAQKIVTALEGKGVLYFIIKLIN